MLGREAGKKERENVPWLREALIMGSPNLVEDCRRALQAPFTRIRPHSTRMASLGKEREREREMVSTEQGPLRPQQKD